MATSSLDKLGLNSTNDQQRNVNTSYAIGLINNNAKKSQGDLSFQQRIGALQDKLDQERSQLPNRFAQRGVLNSGIYNFDGVPGGDFSNMGARQQFALNSATSLGNLRAQQTSSDQGFDQGNQSLALAWSDASSAIPGIDASDAARNAIANAVKGA